MTSAWIESVVLSTSMKGSTILYMSDALIRMYDIYCQEGKSNFVNNFQTVF